MSSLSLYQPTISRNAVGRTLFRGPRSGAPAPDHSPRPNRYSSQVWRPPRSRPGTRHDYVPPLVQETQHQLPWRAERQRQRRKESSIFGHGTRRDEAGRITDPRPTATSVEQPASYQPLFSEQDRGHRRHPRVPRERIRYPERRPSHTRHVSPNAQEDYWRELPSGHRVSEQQGYYPTHFNESPRYDYDRDRCRYIPQRERYSTSFNPLYDLRTSSYDNVLPTPSHAGSKRWSWSSDSSSLSTNSAVSSWSSSSPTFRSSSVTPQEVRPNPHESDIRFRHPETSSHWSRSHDVETSNGWMDDNYFIPSGDLSVVDNDEYVRSPSTDHNSGEDGGQTVVYTDCEIVARDLRIADLHQRTRDFGGMSVVQLPREAARGLDPSSSSDADRAERSRRIESRETIRRKRPYVLPIWPELPPRKTNNIRRVEGIRYRYPRDSDDTPEPENVYPELAYKI